VDFAKRVSKRMSAFHSRRQIAHRALVAVPGGPRIEEVLDAQQADAEQIDDSS